MGKLVRTLFRSPDSEFRKIKANCVTEAKGKYNNFSDTFKVDVISRLSVLETMFRNHLEHHRFMSWTLITISIGLLICITSVAIKLFL